MRLGPSTALGLALVALLIAGGLVGCQGLFRSGKSMTIAGTPPSSGHLIHVVGWNGPVGGDHALLDALADGGLPYAMETFDWTDGHRMLGALRHSQRSPVPRRRLAERVTALWREDAGRPIFLTADSSGCGVVLEALALLPGDVRVRTVIFSSPAVSPGYDLTRALERIDGELVSFNSTRDWFILGLGTTLFGTVDGRHESAAGRRGFAVRAGSSSYARLVQVPYDPNWRKAYGHDGLHTRSLEPRFAKAMLVPILMSGQRSCATRSGSLSP